MNVITDFVRDLPDWVIRWARFIIPAFLGTVAGVWLEHNVWKGRAAGVPGVGS